MKRIILIFHILLILLVPFNLFAQITINDGLRVRVYNGSKLDVTGNAVVEANAELIIEGTVDVSGSFTNNGTNSTVTIKSDNSSTGSLIFASGTPGATVERYLTDNAWHFITPTTTGITVANFNWSDTPKSWVTSHDEGDNSWTYLTNLSTSLNVGQGYMVWLDNNTKQDATATMSGNLRSANLSPTVTNSSSGWNAVGNPFSSAIDWDLGTWTKTNITSTVYVWDNSSNDYLIWNGTEGTLTDGVIPISQGFFVDAEGTPTLTIPADARVHSSTDIYKSTKQTANPYLRIDLNGVNTSNTIFIGFPEHGTEEFDMVNGDGRKLYSSNETPQIFVIEDNTELCINTTKPITEGESKTIPINMIQIIDGDYNFTFGGANNLPDYDISFEDTKNSEIIDLKKQSTFNFNASSNDNTERFLLHFAYSPDGIEDSINETNPISIYSYGKTIYVRNDNSDNGMGTIKIYDLYGRLIFDKTTHFTHLTSFTTELSNSYVVVKLIMNSRVYSEKLFIK